MNNEEYEKSLRKKAVDDFLAFARKVAKRDSWFIGGFLGEVYSEWLEKQ